MSGQAPRDGVEESTRPPLPDPTGGPVHAVDDQAGLEALAARVQRADVVALDVEANSLHAYQEEVCVIQVTIDGESWIVDPLAVDDLAPLRDALDREDVLVLLHGGDYDIATLSRDHDFAFHQVFDTMIAATILGDEKVGLANLVLQAYGVELNKKFQTVDWARRPLTKEQIDYLYRDTVYLPGLHEQFSARLEEADLVEEADIEFAYLAGRRGAPLRFDPETWRRVKGTAKLGAEGRAVMRELWAWRDEEAEKRNVPPFKVLGPKTLLALAENPPLGARQAGDVAALYPRERRRYGWAVLEASRAGAARAKEGDAPPKDLKPKLSAEEVADRKRARKIEEAIKAWRRVEAQARKVPNLVVLPNRALVWLVRELPDHVEALDACPDLGPKRVERYGQALIDVIGKAGT